MQGFLPLALVYLKTPKIPYEINCLLVLRYCIPSSKKKYIVKEFAKVRKLDVAQKEVANHYPKQ